MENEEGDNHWMNALPPTIGWRQALLSWVEVRWGVGDQWMLIMM